MSNYYQKSLQILDKIKKSGQKPTLLMQVCCGPCSLTPLEKLSEVFDITVIYNNSNLISLDEFDKRLHELKDVILRIKLEKNISIKLLVFPYNHEEYMKDLYPYADEKEGNTRCQICYKKRMIEAYKYANDNKFDYFTTSLTSGRQKNSNTINMIAEELEKQFDFTKYFYSDFKKKARGEIGYAKARERGYYLQEFCGCEFSENLEKLK